MYHNFFRPLIQFVLIFSDYFLILLILKGHFPLLQAITCANGELPSNSKYTADSRTRYPLEFCQKVLLQSLPGQTTQYWMQNLIATLCHVVWPLCNMISHRLAGSCNSYYIVIRMRIASTFGTKSMVPLATTSLICPQFFFDNTDKCYIRNIASFGYKVKFTFAPSRKKCYTKRYIFINRYLHNFISCSVLYAHHMQNLLYNTSFYYFQTQTQ